MNRVPLFTPRHVVTGERVRWENVEVPHLPRRGEWAGTWYPMTNPDGVRVEVRSAPCSLSGCHCDAEFREVSPPRPLPRIYRIIRFREAGRPRTLLTRLTLAECQAHCSGPKTRGVRGGVRWFDGFDLMRGYTAADEVQD